MKAVIYARVSSSEQDKEGFSIPAQLKLLRNYAKTDKLKVCREFIDVETAKTPGRVKFNEMIDFLRSNRDVLHILVEKTDRLYRNFKDFVLLEDLDIEIILVKEGEKISKESHSHAKFIHGIKVLMAKNYIDNLSEEVKKGMREKAEQGDWPGKAPIGYLNNKADRRVEVDPIRASMVKRMFELYASGNYSLSKLRKKIYSDGLKSTNGMQLFKSMVERILKNPFYFGEFIWNSERYSGNHEPLISRSLFEQVQLLLRRDGKPKTRKDTFIFSGLLICGRCGCQITAEIKKGIYIYYHCTSGRGKCDQPYVREELIDTLFAEKLKGMQLDDEAADWIVTALKESSRNEGLYRQSELMRLKRLSKSHQTRLDKAYEDRLDGIIDEKYWIELSKRWRAEQATISDRIESLDTKNRDYVKEGMEIIELAQNAHSLYVAQNSSEKRDLIKSLLSNCTLNDRTLCPTYRKPFNHIVEGIQMQVMLPR